MRELGVQPLVAQVLVRRGLEEPAAARRFLAADEAHDPGRFEGIDAACELIERHVASGSPILVHGDYDADGVCSTAILVEVLRELGADPKWFIPGRQEDGYGLSMETVERVAGEGYGLLITADCAITAVEEVTRARSLGLDVVVTDHHRPRADGALPEAPIVHPEVSGYPFGELCAAGVAHKLAQQLRRHRNRLGRESVIRRQRAARSARRPRRCPRTAQGR
ncbi:MAG: DHH family phosphoesterase, partial [Solirubrobacterales bacterium]